MSVAVASSCLIDLEGEVCEEGLCLGCSSLGFQHMHLVLHEQHLVHTVKMLDEIERVVSLSELKMELEAREVHNAWFFMGVRLKL